MSEELKEKKIDLEIKRAAQLSVTEIGIGSLGHGFKIPLTGQVLSLNQLAFLLNALNSDALPRSAVFEISGIAALLKSFSPAGQKLGPMLSISTQGFLFWLGISVFGTNFFGQILGAILLSLWAFIQPLITLFFIYGFDLVNVMNFYLKRLNDDYAFIASSIGYAVIALLTVKMSIAVVFVFYSLAKKTKLTLIRESKFSSQILSQIPKGSQKNAAKAAFFDLFKPLFLFSFLLMFVFVCTIDASLSQKIWLTLRPVASAFLLFYVLRSQWVGEKMINFSRKSKTFERIYLKSKTALDLISTKFSQND